MKGGLLSLYTGTIVSLFSAIPTESHAAPTAGLSARSVKEEKRAGRLFAGLYPSEILSRQEVRYGVGDRQE